MVYKSLVRKKSVIKELINKGMWSNEREHYELVIVHRGVKGDRLVIRLSEVKEVTRGYIVLDDTMIPLHRVVEIRYKGRVIFSRRPRRQEKTESGKNS